MRMSISIPETLKARMNRVKEDVNWSSIACRAFEQKLGEIASRKEKKKTVDVIERLRASRHQRESEAFKIGFKWGQEWAKNDADLKQLERLGKLYDNLTDEPSNDWKQYFEDKPDCAYATCERLYFQLEPDDEEDRDETRDFWERAAGEDWETDIQDGRWVRGFAEGALDIWNEVKGKI